MGKRSDLIKSFAIIWLTAALATPATACGDGGGGDGGGDGDGPAGVAGSTNNRAELLRDVIRGQEELAAIQANNAKIDKQIAAVELFDLAGKLGAPAAVSIYSKNSTLAGLGSIAYSAPQVGVYAAFGEEEMALDAAASVAAGYLSVEEGIVGVVGTVTSIALHAKDAIQTGESVGNAFAD
jgi:hypothetical protein